MPNGLTRSALRSCQVGASRHRRILFSRLAIVCLDPTLIVVATIAPTLGSRKTEFLQAGHSGVSATALLSGLGAGGANCRRAIRGQLLTSSAWTPGCEPAPAGCTPRRGTVAVRIADRAHRERRTSDPSRPYDAQAPRRVTDSVAVLLRTGVEADARLDQHRRAAQIAIIAAVQSGHQRTAISLGETRGRQPRATSSGGRLLKRIHT